MKKIILRYGLISGAISATFMVGSMLYFHDSMNFENGELFGYSSMLLSMMFVFLGVRAYRDKVLEGYITFGKAFQVGILISVISCLIYVIAWLFVYHNFMPDFMDKYITYTLEKLQASGATAEKIAEETQKMEGYKEMYKSPFMRFIMTFLEPFPVGVLVTLVSAAILRRKVA